jgi:hypothetical protein
MNSSKEQQDWDTNYGWWTDKPERNARLGSNAGRYPASVNRSERVWSEAALVVGLALSLVLSLVSLASR